MEQKWSLYATRDKENLSPLMFRMTNARIACKIVRRQFVFASQGQRALVEHGVSTAQEQVIFSKLKERERNATDGCSGFEQRVFQQSTVSQRYTQ